VRTGQLRFFLIGDTDEAGGGPVAGFALGSRGAAAATVDDWVERACATVPAADYQAAAGTPGSGLGGLGAGGGLGTAADTLYACKRTA
jgi:hypothetical protein